METEQNCVKIKNGHQTIIFLSNVVLAFHFHLSFHLLHVILHCLLSYILETEEMLCYRQVCTYSKVPLKTGFTEQCNLICIRVSHYI